MYYNVDGMDLTVAFTKPKSATHAHTYKTTHLFIMLLASLLHIFVKNHPAAAACSLCSAIAAFSYALDE